MYIPAGFGIIVYDFCNCGVLQGFRADYQYYFAGRYVDDTYYVEY